VDLAEIFQKNIVISTKLIFFELLEFFRPVSIVSYLQM